MFTKSDILARLQGGETIDAIAEEMTAVLNEAQAEKEILDAESAAKKDEETRVLEAKRAAVDIMLDGLCDYLVAADATEMLDELHEVDTDKVIDMLDGTIRFAKSLEAMKNLEFQEVDRKNDIVGHFFGLLG